MENLETPALTQEAYVDVHDARFVDKLSPEYENLWSLLVTQAMKLEMSREELIESVVTVSEIPQAFKDRTLLLRYGSLQAQTSVGLDKFGWRMRSQDWTPPVKSETQKLEEFNWLCDARAFQEKNGFELLDDRVIYTHAFYFFDKKLIDEGELDGWLNSIDRLYHVLSTSDNDDYPLPSQRFSVLADKLLYFESSERVKQWALESLERWLQAEIHPEQKNSLPKWMARPETGGREITGQNLYIELLKRVGGKIEGLDWDYLRPAIRHFGWKKLIRDTAWGANLVGRDGLRLIPRIDDDALQQDLLDYVFMHQNDYIHPERKGTHYRPHELKDVQDTMIEFALKYGRQDIVNQIKSEVTAYDLEESQKAQRWAAREAREKEVHEIKKQAYVQQKMEVSRRFEGLLEILGNT